LLNNDGVILSNHNITEEYPLQSSRSALDPKLIKRLLNSLGDPDDAFLLTEDLGAFSIKIISPHHPEFRPVFFDRKNEYGKNHTYYEALCHALPTRDVLSCSSARYYNNHDGNSLMTKHLPCPLPITAFIESVRNINSTFLQHLETSLLSLTQTYPPEPGNPQEIVKDFINGTFRNVAIQIHYNSPTYERPMLYHMDHVFSALHMAVTLNGRRTIGFSKSRDTVSDFTEVSIDMQAGDVYVTTPAAILHGISVDNLEVKDRSVALQCRTLLGPESSKYWSKHVTVLCVEVGKLLAQYPIRLPSYIKWEREYTILENQLIIPENKDFLFEQEDLE
jgi:hypothetical protein